FLWTSWGALINLEAQVGFALSVALSNFSILHPQRNLLAAETDSAASSTTRRESCVHHRSRTSATPQPTHSQVDDRSNYPSGPGRSSCSCRRHDFCRPNWQGGTDEFKRLPDADRGTKDGFCVKNGCPPANRLTIRRLF